jgi:dihydrofolate reductase
LTRFVPEVSKIDSASNGTDPLRANKAVAQKMEDRLVVSGHVFIATSLDGFIARPDGALDWLFGNTNPSEDHGYDSFMERMDGVVMGRGTFDTVRRFEAWPYSKPVVVMSRSLNELDLPPELAERVRITTEQPRALFERLGQEGWRRAYVDGGATIRSFLAEQLIVELILSRVPVLIGTGRPLFGGTRPDLLFEHRHTEAFPSGLVQSRYEMKAVETQEIGPL